MSLHHTVLREEAVQALVTDLDGIYVDGTFGRGGHSRSVLDMLSDSGRLLGVDKDPAAEKVAQQLAASDGRFAFYHGSFADVPACLAERDISAVNGILLDLGVSSPQLDEGERGFSFTHDGPLDMRMDTTRGETAAQWLNRAEESDIAYVLKAYGEERYARRIAAAIVAERQERPLETTGQLAEVVKVANPRWEKHKHPATRAFQGVRIHINQELMDLQRLLDSALDNLICGGRLVILSFQSLEDRMVKRFMRDQARGDEIPAGVPVLDSALNKRVKIIGKAVKASAEEVASNPRARSVVMRVAEKLA